jgi:hypothetical protein
MFRNIPREAPRIGLKLHTGVQPSRNHTSRDRHNFVNRACLGGLTEEDGGGDHCGTNLFFTMGTSPISSPVSSRPPSEADSYRGRGHTVCRGNAKRRRLPDALFPLFFSARRRGPECLAEASAEHKKNLDKARWRKYKCLKW